MECDRLGSPETGQLVLSEYQRASGDRPGRELLAFYKSYRASIRAKVALLRAGQQSSSEQAAKLDECNSYLRLAEHYLQTSWARPTLILVTGLSGTGKSTLARGLGEELGIGVLRTDELRSQLSDLVEPAARYHPETRGRVYDNMLELAGSGWPAGSRSSWTAPLPSALARKSRAMRPALGRRGAGAAVRLSARGGRAENPGTPGARSARCVRSATPAPRRAAGRVAGQSRSCRRVAHRYSGRAFAAAASCLSRTAEPIQRSLAWRLGAKTCAGPVRRRAQPCAALPAETLAGNSYRAALRTLHPKNSTSPLQAEIRPKNRLASPRA